MSTRKSKNQEYYDGWEGLAKDMAKQCKVTHSQCYNCKNSVGTSGCKVFGEIPYKYGSTFANVQCPEREEVDDGE